MHEVPISDIDKYFIWAKDKLDVDFKSDRCKENYDLNVTNVHAATTGHVFSRKLGMSLEKCREQYSEDTKSELFMTPSESEIKWLTKEYRSVLDKSYRYNVIENLGWPSEPSGGWMKPENWFSKLNDTVRTRIVCKYIDGPKFLAEQLVALATDLGLKSHFISRQKDDGYYAYHFYTGIPVSGLIGAKPEKVEVDVEIQITTQLQDALSQITHLYYEDRRNRRESDPSSWKWEIDTNRFRIGYLSHTLHLLEAIILEARNEALGPVQK